jgi:hypothetical protein
VFKPDLGGSWVEYNGATLAPTLSPAPTARGGCDNPHNSHLDRCFRKMHPRKASAVAWQSLGPVGQLSVFLVSFMAITLSLSIFLARARKKRRRGESYLGFLVRDLRKSGKKRGLNPSSKKKKRRTKNKDLEEDMLGDRPPRHRSKSKSRSKSRSHKSGESRSKSRSHKSGESRSKSRSHGMGGEESSSRHRSSSRHGGDRESKRSSSRHHRSSSKSRSSSKRREEGHEHRSRGSSRRRSNSRDGKASRSRSRSRREGISIPGDDVMSRRQLV